MTTYTAQYGWVSQSALQSLGATYQLGQGKNSYWAGTPDATSQNNSSGIVPTGGITAGFGVTLDPSAIWPVVTPKVSKPVPNGYIGNTTNTTFSLPSGTQQIMLYLAFDTYLTESHIAQDSNVSVGAETFSAIQIAAQLNSSASPGLNLIQCAIPYLQNPAWTPPGTGWGVAITQQNVGGGRNYITQPQVLTMGWSKPSGSAYPQPPLAFVLLTATTGSFGAIQITGLGDGLLGVQAIESTTARGSSSCTNPTAPAGSLVPFGALYTPPPTLVCPPSPAAVCPPASGGAKVPCNCPAAAACAPGTARKCAPCPAPVCPPSTASGAVAKPCPSATSSLPFIIAAAIAAAALIVMIFLAGFYGTLVKQTKK